MTNRGKIMKMESKGEKWLRKNKSYDLKSTKKNSQELKKEESYRANRQYAEERQANSCPDPALWAIAPTWTAYHCKNMWGLSDCWLHKSSSLCQLWC